MKCPDEAADYACAIFADNAETLYRRDPSKSVRGHESATDKLAANESLGSDLACS